MPLSGVVAKRVTLTRRGHEFSGLCPFHNEKTPSFTVNDDKGFYHCFGCQEHGSVFDFVMKTDGLEFIQAVAQLARDAGLDMPALDRSGGSADTRQRDSLYDLMEAAAAWFEGQLVKPAGADAGTYLDGRGLKSEALQHFRVGFAPNDRQACKQAMTAKGYSERALIKAGLVVTPEDGAQTYDRFRDRVMFPITDSRGRVIAFGGRALGDARAKYLNSPETSLFHKGSVLYNLAGARAAVRDAGSVTVVEGYMDVVALWQAGFPAVVAPLGTAVTERQMAELWRLAPEPVLCMDGDAAGWKAAQRAAHRSLPELRPGHSLRFALLPGGEDPDSLVRGGAGSAGMRKVLDEALPLAEVLWRTAAGGDFSTPERRAGLRKEVFELASHIRDATVREYYRRHFTAKLDDLFGAAGRDGRRPRSGRRYGPPMGGKLSAAHGLRGSGDRVRMPETRRVRVLLATVLNHPEILESVFEDLCALHIGDPELDKLSNEIIDIAGRETVLDTDQLNTHLSSRGLSRIVQVLTGPSSGLAEKFARPEASVAEAEAGWRETMGQHHRTVNLTADRDAAVKALGENMTETEFARLTALQAEQEQQQDSGEDVVAMPGGQVWHAAAENHKD